MQIDTKELENLKLDLVLRKIKKSFQETNIIDDTNINYLNDCLNLSLDNLTLKDLILIIQTNNLPDNYILQSKDIIDISLNSLTSNENYIILEPLENKINDISKLDCVNIKFKTNITLNSKDIILVKEDKEITQDYLEKYNIIKYKGDIKIVLSKVLILYGYKPQELKDKEFKNQENNKILLNYLRNNYSNKIPIKNKQSLIDRQTKELSVRDEVLSIIRKSPILIIDDIDITPQELVILAEYYKSIHGLKDKDLDELEFSDFVNIYGVRLNDSGLYLLDDDNLVKGEYAKENIIQELYKIYLRNKKNYKERLGIISNRKNILKSINETEIKDKRNISIEELGILYKEYQKNNSNDNSVQRFMQNVGIRINNYDEIYLLNDDETINLMEFIESRDEDKMAIYLRDNLNLDCYTESEKDFGKRLKSMHNVNLSFEGLEELFAKEKSV